MIIAMFRKTAFKSWRRVLLASLVAASLVAAFAGPAEARTRLENICTISGQQEQTLIGLGLVTGLKGTGDGGKYLPMINALGMALRKLDSPATGPADLKDAGN